MLLACALAADQLCDQSPDLIVLPEGVDRSEVDRAARAFPHAVVAAALVEKGRSRGYLMHAGSNRISYWKVGTDGATTGSGEVSQSPIWTSGELAIAMLICMDAQDGAFSRSVVAELHAASARIKVLCIPADMAAAWFPGDTLSPMFKGVFVALCNHTLTYQRQDRCKSFIADPSARKIVTQDAAEPIQLAIP